MNSLKSYSINSENCPKNFIPIMYERKDKPDEMAKVYLKLNKNLNWVIIDMDNGTRILAIVYRVNFLK